MQIPVVGHRDMRHAHLIARVEHVLQPRGTVQQRVLGVNVQMRERGFHHYSRLITTVDCLDRYPSRVGTGESNNFGRTRHKDWLYGGNEGLSRENRRTGPAPGGLKP
ncbi:hypothetical protein GCM10010349_20660 [Streptomyces flavofungini]|nr:hypothetical protein GCM10010349_20660 [Streptomyces flavofungini]